MNRLAATGCGLFVASVLSITAGRSVRAGVLAACVAGGAQKRHTSSSGSSDADADADANNSSGSGSGGRKKSMVYTKTGDSGTSSLYNGERRAKTDGVFDALGSQDELGASVGIAREHCAIAGNGLDEMLLEIQSRIFDLGACVATPAASSASAKIALTMFSPRFTAQLEAWIDELDAQLPPLTNFVVASGGLSSVHLNHARAVCRRAERTVVPLVAAGACDAEVGRYLNRLSDLLFVAGRAAVQREGKSELLWRKGAQQ